MFYSYPTVHLSQNFWLLGSMEQRNLSTAETQLINDYYHTSSNLNKITAFFRLQREREVIYSEEYKRVKLRNSFTVNYTFESSILIGKILFYVIYNNKPAAILIKLQQLANPRCFSPNKSIIPIEITSHLQIIPIEHIGEKCIYMEIDNSYLYVVKLPCKLLID